MRPLFPMLLVMLAWCASAAPITETAVIPTHAPAMLVLHDQFDVPQTLAFPTTNITLLTIADRTGSAQLAGWIAPVKHRYGERIDIRGIADVSPVPRPLRSLVRKKFRELQTYPVMMDWTGEVCAQLSYQKDVANILVLDRNGRIQARFTGVATAAAVAEAGVVLDKLLATAQEQKP
jgi:hypothetical protein